MEESILSKFTLEGQLARAAYLLLRKGIPVRSKEIFMKAWPYKGKNGKDGEDYYNLGERKSKLSNAIKSLKQEFEKEGCKPEDFTETIDPTDGKSKIYQYKGEDDPLAHRLLSLSKEYYDFIKASIPMLPREFYAYMLGETDIPETLETQANHSEPVIYHGNGFIQRHSDLIAELYDFIGKKKTITFMYENFSGKVFRVFISPHVLKEFNGRWFLFGATKNKKNGEVQISQFALDRIASNVEKDKSEDATYISPEKGYYKDFFSERVGVSQKFLIDPCDIILRTHDASTHGRLVTKKLHQRQDVISDYTEEKGYGEIKLHVGVTIELVALILSQGEGVSVVQPLELRDIISKKLQEMVSHY